MDSFVQSVLALAITIAIFLGLRKFLWRYWGIDQLIKVQQKQALYLEYLIRQNGELPKITVKEIATGVEKDITIDGWIDLQLEFPDRFERVKK
jgi:hypothetical protein